MDDIDDRAGHRVPKRTDVGYKRPPREHQFKKGNKPRRRAKAPPADPDAQLLLWKILQEQRRVMIGGKAAWLTNAEILIRKAFELADQGSPTMNRVIAEMIMARELAELQREPEMSLFIDGELMPWSV